MIEFLFKYRKELAGSKSILKWNQQIKIKKRSNFELKWIHLTRIEKYSTY